MAADPRPRGHLARRLLAGLLTAAATLLPAASPVPAAELQPADAALLLAQAAPSPGAAGRRQQLSPEERARFKECLERWRQLDPRKQAELRERYERFKQLPSD